MSELRSTYNPSTQNLAQQTYIKEQLIHRTKMLEKIQEKVHSCAEEELSVIALMDIIEKLLHSCGGETKANFLEVSRDFIRLYTRVPIDANIYPFLPFDDPQNKRMQIIFIELLLSIKMVKGIRWIPSSEVEGSQIIISFDKR